MHALSLKSLSWYLVFVTGLSVSIGWGVRGQFGHEYGAALAGALGGMTIALLSGTGRLAAEGPLFRFLWRCGFRVRRRDVVYEDDRVQPLLPVRSEQAVALAESRSYAGWIRNAVVFGLVGAAAVCFAGWGAKRALYGDKFTGVIYQNHIRFGPDNTNTVK